MNLDLIQLASAFGESGRSWAQFQCDDAVQDYVDAHDDYENHIESWQAAWQAGEAEYLAKQGWVSRWTTAPKDYDTFGTKTAEQCGEWKGSPLRRILCHPHHAGYQESRNGSGNYPTWSEDPRIEEREHMERRERLDRLRAEDEARRAAGLIWLTAAAESEIEEARDRDEVESRGLTYMDLRDELVRRDATREAEARAAEWARCRAAFQDGAILVDEGTPGMHGVYGWIAGKPTHIHYNVRVIEHWAHPGDADEASVTGDERGTASAGSLSHVAAGIECGRYRVVPADDVPPEPVTRRIGHERWKEILKIQVGVRTVWVGRKRFSYDPMVLDAAGRIVRAKAVCELAIKAAQRMGLYQNVESSK
jgi:hypothetical protein